MKLKDLLYITGGNTNIVLQGVSTNNIVSLWNHKVEEIDFSNIPYGECEVIHQSVPEEDDYIIVQVDECNNFTESMNSENSDKIMDIIKSNEHMLKLFNTDNNFRTSIEILMSSELSIKQIIGVIFMLCDGHRNITDELVKYINKYGILS